MNRRDWLAIAALAGSTVFLFSQYLLVQPAPFIYPNSSLGTDLPREMWPLADFVSRTLQSTGTLPLWRPYLLSGAPLVGHPVIPLFYPLHWIALALPLALAFNLDFAFHIFWMGAGAYLYLRLESRVRMVAAFTGALVFSLAPMWVAQISGGHMPNLTAIAWWPWIWLAANRFMSTGKYRWSVVAGISLAAQLLNHGMFAYLSVCALAAASLAWIIRRRMADLHRLLTGWGIALAVAFSLSAVQLLPFLELIGSSTRAGIDPVEASFASLPPVMLLNIFFPPDLPFPEWFLYPGIGALALALYGWYTGWSNRERIAAAVFAAGLVMSLGSYTPLANFLYSILPGYSFFRVPTRWWIFSLFALSLLAAWGMEKWIGRAPRPLPRRILLPAAVILFYAAAAAVQFAAGNPLPYIVLPAAVGMIFLILLLLGAESGWKLGIVILLVGADLYWTSTHLILPQPENNIATSDQITRYLAEAAGDSERVFAPYGELDGATLVQSGLRAADGYDSFILDSYARFAAYASGCDYAGFSVSAPATASNPAAAAACPEFTPRLRALALLNVRYVLLPGPAQIPGSTFVAALADRWLYQLPPGMGRAFGVAQAVAAPAEKCLDTLDQIDPAKSVVLERSVPLPGDGRPPAVISRTKEVNREVFTVEAGNAGILIRSESWAPGWKASVDSESADVLKADCALQGVFIQPGRHTIVFTYAPDGFLIGRWISLGACILLAGISILCAVRKLRDRHR